MGRLRSRLLCGFQTELNVIRAKSFHFPKENSQSPDYFPFSLPIKQQSNLQSSDLLMQKEGQGIEFLEVDFSTDLRTGQEIKRGNQRR